MHSIFLAPEQTFGVSVTVKHSAHGVPSFAVDGDGPYRLRTATGREYHRIQKAYYEQSAPEAYALLAILCTDGIPKDKIEQVHPDCVWALLLEVLKRSRVSEADAGN